MNGQLKVLITGSSGQIGTNLGLRLIESGHLVQGIDRRGNAWTDRIPTVLADLCRPGMGEVLAGVGDAAFDVVVHLAAHAKVHELVVHPDRALENIVSTFHVLEFCRRTRAPIIFGSSREVYGDIRRHLTDERQADFVVAESPYSASKISGEAMIYSYARCYGLPHLVFRFSNVYGRFDNDLGRMERVIPLFIDRLSRGIPVTIYGKEKVFDFTYVDDCVDGIARGIERLTAGSVQNQTINLAYGQGSTLVDLVRYIAEELGIEEPDVHYEPARPGEVLRYIADIRKAQSLLGYDPRTPLREGIRKSIAWAREHGDLRAPAAGA